MPKGYLLLWFFDIINFYPAVHFKSISISKLTEKSSLNQIKFFSVEPNKFSFRWIKFSFRRTKFPSRRTNFFLSNNISHFPSQYKMKRAIHRIKSMNEKFSLKRINTHCMMAPRTKQIFACKFSFSPIYNWTDTIWWRERRIQLLYS